MSCSYSPVEPNSTDIGSAGNQFIDMLEATIMPAMGPLTMGSVMV
jgi:hypothetical protein